MKFQRYFWITESMKCTLNCTNKVSSVETLFRKQQEEEKRRHITLTKISHISYNMHIPLTVSKKRHNNHTPQIRRQPKNGGIKMKQCMDAENLHRRLKKIIGQVQAIDKMVDEDVPCEVILAQIKAAISALHIAGQVVL